MKSPFVVKLEGWIAFLTPFLSLVGGSGVLTDTPAGKVIALICLALVAGLSGLKSFLSTTFSDSLPAALASAIISPKQTPDAPAIKPTETK